MKRRKFIGIIGVGIAVTAGGSYLCFEGFDNAIERILKGEIKDLKLKVDDREIVLFLNGAKQAGLWESYSISKKELIRWCAALENLGIRLDSFERYKWCKEEIIQQFLLSTSLFYGGMDSNKPIHYLRIYDPYTTPCCNPFSNLYYSA